MTRLVWYRNDLRLRHAGLRDALDSGESVRALYMLCPHQWDRHGVADARRWYVLESLRELGQGLARRGIPLDVIDAGDFEHCPEVLADIVRRHQINAIHCSREYPLNEKRRDQAVAERMTDLGVAVHGRDETVLVPPQSLRTGQGTPYTVFTPYSRAWHKVLDRAPQLPEQPPRTSTSVAFPGEAAIDQALSGLQVPEAVRHGWPPGEAAAQRRLTDFLQGGLHVYCDQRDDPGKVGTSRLSAALSAGTLAPAEAWWRARQTAEGSAGAAAWVNELAWRDFYRQVMALFPRLSRGEAFQPVDRMLPWETDEGLWQAWCQGRTGYPLVDAAMRQLVHQGWMHNRLRMVTAMFLTKHLMIDWRRGERFFMEHLIDGDFASNNGGWQWSASVGTDAVPYFRVFNPVRQSQRFDPQGRFIARYVPELAHLDASSIHEPWKVPMMAPDYPEPVVAHQGVRDRVADRFRQARQRLEATGG